MQGITDNPCAVIVLIVSHSLLVISSPLYELDVDLNADDSSVLLMADTYMYFRSTDGSYLQELRPVTPILADVHFQGELLRIIGSTLKQIMMIGANNDKGKTEVVRALNPPRYLHVSYKTALLKNDGITDENEIENINRNYAAYVGKFESANDVSGDWQGPETDTAVNKESAKLDMNLKNGYEDEFQSVAKRQYIYCGTKKITLNMLLEYFRTGILCGNKTSNFRFGIGK